jgi:hypothetical protein
VVELDAIELVLEGSYSIAVCFHLVVVAARILHDLVNHELRNPPHIEAPDAYLDGDLEAAKEGLVFSHVVRRGEVEAHRIPHVLPKGQHEEQARARPGLHHRAVEVRSLALCLDLQWWQLCICSFSDEVRQDLGLDGLARGVG